MPRHQPPRNLQIPRITKEPFTGSGDSEVCDISFQVGLFAERDLQALVEKWDRDDVAGAADERQVSKSVDRVVVKLTVK